MEQRIDKLILEAINVHGEDITPCNGKATLYESITMLEDTLLLWFNDNSGSTRIISE